MVIKEDGNKICKNCKGKKGQHFPQTYGLVCPGHKYKRKKKYFKELKEEEE